MLWAGAPPVDRALGASGAGALRLVVQIIITKMHALNGFLLTSPPWVYLACGVNPTNYGPMTAYVGTLGHYLYAVHTT